MLKKILILVVLLILAACSRSSQPTELVMGYWSYPKSLKNQHFVSLYPMPGSFDEKGKVVLNQDFQDKLNYLDIVVYAYLHVNNNGVVHFRNSEIDLSTSDNIFCAAHKIICTDDQGKYTPKFGNFSAFSRLDNKTHHLKKVLSVFEDPVNRGEINPGSLAAIFHHIPAFVDSVATIIEAYHLDGVDLDLEPNSFTPEQADAYGKLVTALREKLGQKMLIFATVAADQNIKRESWKIIAEKSSYVSDMCYDFHTPFFSPYITGYNSNLYSDPNEPMLSGYVHISCDQSIKQLTFLGVPAQKIILGYPSYAIIYGGVNNKNHGLFQSFARGKTPKINTEMKVRGHLPFRMMSKLLQSGFKPYATFANQHISANWAYNEKTQQFVTYDSTNLVHEKLDYVRKNHLAGLMTWSLNDDAPVTSDNSLLKIARGLQRSP